MRPDTSLSAGRKVASNAVLSNADNVGERPIGSNGVQLASKTDHFLRYFQRLSRIKAIESSGFLERAMGIEPTSEAWEASILPLYDARSKLILLHLSCNQSRFLFSNIFQNINFIAKLGTEFCLDLVERNLSGVARRHRRRRVCHLLADHGRS